jgi:SAM-dependent methyltransferase
MTTATVFTNEQLRPFYREDYFRGREYVDYLADKSAHQKTLARHLRVVRRYVPPGGQLLEIGCAHGFFLELALPIYPGSVGLDIATSAVAAATGRGLDVRAGDLAEQRFDEGFEAVCLWDTIEHLAEPDAVLKRACSLLKPGGYLFLSTGDFGALLPRLRGRSWRQIHPPTHLFYFTRPSLRALCCRLGLEVVRFGTVRVYRRLGSALQAMARGGGGPALGRLATAAQRLVPASILTWCVPLNLGDTLYLVARRGGRGDL